MDAEDYAARLRAERGALLEETGALGEALRRIEEETAAFLQSRPEGTPEMSDAPEAPEASEAAQCARLSRDACRLRAASDYARYLVSDFEDKLLDLCDLLESARRADG